MSKDKMTLKEIFSTISAIIGAVSVVVGVIVDAFFPEASNKTVPIIIVIIGSVVCVTALSYILWKRVLKKHIKHKNRIELTQFISKVEQLKLNLDQSEHITQTFLDRYPVIYFPVVPRERLNIIHSVFARRIYQLQQLGFKVVVLIFDDYYRRVKNFSKERATTDIVEFVYEFKKHGAKAAKFVYESKINANPFRAQKVLNQVLDLCSKFKINEIRKIREETARTTKEDDSYIKQQKILYNMAYLAILEKEGFVLCGQDENYMWHEFKNKAALIEGASGLNSEMFILSIDKMSNANGLDTSIWDDDNTDAVLKQEIEKLVRRNLSNKNSISANCGIFYLLNNLYFDDGNTIEIVEDSTSVKQFTNIDDLISYLLSMYDDSILEGDKVPQKIIESLVETLYSINKKEQNNEKIIS